VLELAEPVTAKLRQNETLVRAIERLRGEVAAAQNHLSVVKRAPLPLADAKKLAAAHVKAMAARPKVWVDGRGEFAVTFVDAQRIDTLATLDDIAAMLAFADPEGFTKRLEDEIDRQLGDPTQPAMPKAETDKRAAELAANLVELERQEESLIDLAASDGVDVMRRADADPRAVLGIVVAAKVKALAAA
jgi:hypothetical protein